jgi:hypothetical protein
VSAEEFTPEVTGVVASDGADPAWWRVFAEPAVVAMLLATVAHVARRNVTDVVVFLGMAGVVSIDRVAPVRDACRRLPEVSTRAVVATALGYGLLIVPLVRGGGLMRLVLALPGLLALVLLLRTGESERRAGAPGRGWVVWTVLLVSGCLFELANFLVQPDPMTPNHDHPVLSDIVEPWLGNGPARGAFCALWLFLGWRLLRVLVTSEEDS